MVPYRHELQKHEIIQYIHLHLLKKINQVLVIFLTEIL